MVWCAALSLFLERKIPDSEFGQVIPDVDEYTKEPPILPPHLRHIILNKVCVNVLCFAFCVYLACMPSLPVCLRSFMWLVLKCHSAITHHILSYCVLYASACMFLSFCLSAVWSPAPPWMPWLCRRRHLCPWITCTARPSRTAWWCWASRSVTRKSSSHRSSTPPCPDHRVKGTELE